MTRYVLAVLALLAVWPGGRARAVEVDLELVLAVDVSLSMDLDEQTIQREGYLAAMVDPAVLNAIAQGPLQRIAVTYVEWAGATEQRIVVGWTLIDGQPAAQGFVRELAAKIPARLRRTSVSGALLFSTPLFEGNGFEGTRRVIDVSGDGANNEGAPVEMARDQAVAKGITINGLPLLLKRPVSTFDMVNLDLFYEDCVIGGPSAFMIPVRSVGEFRDAIRTKLVLEIANLVPPAEALLQPASSGQAPRPPCDIGERQWRNWERGGYQ